MEEWQNADAVAEVLGCHPRNVRRWHVEFQKKATDSEHTAKEPGRPTKLKGNQLDIIRNIIFTKAPRDMNHDATLWSNAIIRDTIQDLFRIQLSLATVNSLTRKMGILRRQILRENGSSDNDALAGWLRDRYPMIRKLARDQNARIFFIHDEAINSDRSGVPISGAGSSPEHDQKRQGQFGTRMLSAICPRNSQRFMVFRGDLVMQPLVAFLGGLMHDIERPLFLIAEAHYKPIALVADPFLAKVADRLSLFFLPKNAATNK